MTFELEEDAVCDDAEAFLLTGALPEGGSYSGAGVSDNVFSPLEAGVGTHTITYTYTSGDNCTQSVEQELVVEMCSGVNDKRPASVSIYPNPFRNSLHLEFSEDRVRMIEFYTAMGQIVLTEHSTGTRVSVDTGSLAAGIYFMRISGEGRMYRVIRSH